MGNLSNFTTIILAGYIDIGNIKYLCFIVLILLFAAIIVANQLIIGIICKEKSLHEPMYVFLCSLSVNEIPEVSLALCHAQIFALYTYGSVEFCNLAIMSYDRYVAICYSLEYHRIMTPARTVWCDNYMLVKLACSDTTANNISGIIGEKTQRALSTCTPHLISLLNYSIGCSFEIIQSRFDKVPMPPVLRVILSIYFLMCPPLINPIMYGMRLSKIKTALKKCIYPRNHIKPVSQ
ncbi:hypothetical protein PO909_002639 [Leuciscus waleckii]